MKLKYVFLLLLVSILPVNGLFAQQKPTVYLIGDSTVRNGQDDGSNGQWGWGTAIKLFFDQDRINVKNRAMGGTSSRTYYTSPTLWVSVLADINPGDYVLMQFGHNDGGAINDASRARATINGIGEESESIVNMLTNQPEVVHTFGWYLRQYIKEIKAKGATPIVCSLIPRNDWDSNNKMKAEGPYANYAADVVAQEKVGYIDLNARARQKLEVEGQSVVTGKYYLLADHTHTIAAGAMLNASAVVEGIRAISGCGLIPYLLDKPSGMFPIKKKLFIVGDSTVADGSGAIVGWGKPIGAMFDTTRLMVINKARGGRSSRTFLYEGLWAEVLLQLQPGDVVLMGFGHNDGAAPNDPNGKNRGSIRGLGDETLMVTRTDSAQELVHSFGWYMTKYVQDTKAKGAFPILFSQIPWNGLVDGKSRRVSDTYGKWLSEIAVKEGVPYVDLNDLVATKFEAMGDEKVNTLYQPDRTHTNISGAEFNAATMIEGLRALGRRNPLSGYIPRPAAAPAQ